MKYPNFKKILEIIKFKFIYYLNNFDLIYSKYIY